MVARALVGLEQHRVFDLVEPTPGPTIDGSDYTAERLQIAGLGRLPQAERED
jgi:hypothetical protein